MMHFDAHQYTVIVLNTKKPNDAVTQGSLLPFEPISNDALCFVMHSNAQKLSDAVTQGTLLPSHINDTAPP